MKYILQTKRLILRGFITADAPFILELVNSPGWLQFIGNRNIKSTEQAIAYLENGPIKSYTENGFGLAMVETKDGKIPIGMCGILKRYNLDHPDIGFAFLPQFMGKGYAFEIANATLAYATGQLQLPTIYAITVPYNIRSIGLLEKIGLKFIKKIRSPENEELLLYSNWKIIIKTKIMAENKTKITKESVTDFIAAVEDEEKRNDSKTLMKIFTDATKEKAALWNNAVIGFGTFHYQSEKSKQAGDWFMTGFSPRKQYITVYIISGVNKYPGLLKNLGKFKASAGSCLNIKRLADINIDVLKQLISESIADMRAKYEKV